MRTAARLFVIITSSAFLCAACGYRDDLYLPKSVLAPAAPTSTPANTNKTN